jgi:anti-sigma factor RsiW
VSREITDAELLAYLDEALAPDELAAIEQELRASPTLQSRAARLLSERDAGGDSVGEIWRRHRLTCPTRSELASGLAGDLPPERADYIRFHLETIGCPVCRANVADLGGAGRDDTSGDAATQERRRKRIFESSVGRYPPRRD